MALSALDWFILIVLAGGLVRGFVVGAVRQVVSLVGLLVAFLFALQFMRPVGALLAQSFGFAESLEPFVGFLVLFAGVQLLFLALSRLFEHVLDVLSLTLLNRAAGGAVGGVKAALLLSLLFFVLAAMEVPAPETRKQSVLYEPVAEVLPRAVEATSGWLPAAKKATDEWGEQLRPQLDPQPRSDSEDEESTLVAPKSWNVSPVEKRVKVLPIFKK